MYVLLTLVLLITAGVSGVVTADQDSVSSQVKDVPVSMETEVKVTQGHTHTDIQASSALLPPEDHVIQSTNEMASSSTTSQLSLHQSAVTSSSIQSVDQSSEIKPSPTELPRTETSLDQQQQHTNIVTQSVTIDQSEDSIQEQAADEKKSVDSLEVVTDKTDPGVDVITDSDINMASTDVNKSTLPQQPHGHHDTDQLQETQPGDTHKDTIQDGSPSVELLNTDTEEVKVKGDSDVKVPTDEKDDKPDEGLTFNEWTQKVRAEEEKDKQNAHQDTPNIPLPPTKQRKKKNYALHECGAKVLSQNPEAENVKSVLNSNKDDYMINPCKSKKWFVVELCEPIQAHSIEIASLELFSSRTKFFRVHFSDRFPTKDWKFGGEFETTDERTVQTFTLTEAHDYFAKFVKVELVDHFGEEHFCPLTLFRVYGTAVMDDEEEHPGISNDGDDDDDDDDNDEDTNTGTGNLLISATNTVINIVKKALNVHQDEQKQVNVTESNSTQSDEGTMNNDSDIEILPCLPIVSDGETTTVTPRPDIVGGVLPEPPIPGKTDSTIVTMLEDHEQIETNLPLVILGGDGETTKTGLDLLHSCEIRSGLDHLKKSKECCQTSKICQFLFLTFRKCVPDSGCDDLESCKHANVTKSEILPTFSDTASVISKSDSVLPSSQADVILSTQLIKDTNSIISDSIQTKEDISKPSPSSSKVIQSSVSRNDVSLESLLENVNISPTHVADNIPQTASPSLSKKQEVDSQTGSKVKTDHDHLEDDIKIDPSPSVVGSREVTLSSTRDVTPSLPDNWKPDTNDLLETKVQNGKQASDSLTVTMLPVTTTVTDSSILLPDQSTPRPASVTAGTNNNGAQPTDNQVHTDTDKTTGEGTDTEASVTDNGDTKTDDFEDKGNGTVVVEKLVQQSDRKDNLDLVRIPVLPINKRESAIMRLSNRIKVLEQNVSLSSRFLEELSRRYKKQSEDMMKMLNSTMAKLNNITVETEVKAKLHEDDMMMMERKVENLTSLVIHLTSSLDTLNKQVTDRQMVWTTIEILIIFIMLVFIVRRQRKEPLPPEIRTLIEAMPTKPAPAPSLSMPPVQRRNSISGPATPSKKMVGDIMLKETMNKFSSETNLALQENKDGTNSINKQGFDGIKKKKRKKQKNVDVRLFNGENSDRCTNPQKAMSHESDDTCHFRGPSPCSAGLLFKVGEYCQSLRATHSPESNPENVDNSSRRLSKTGSDKGKHSPNLGRATGTKKKPPLPASRSHEKQTGTQILPNETQKPNGSKMNSKGHKRQKSLPKPLPKQQNIIPENIGAGINTYNASGVQNSFPQINGSKSLDANASNKGSGLKKSNGIGPSSSNLKPVKRLSPKSSDSTSKNSNTTPPTGRNKKLPQCGIPALYYGSEDPGNRSLKGAISNLGAGQSCQNGFPEYNSHNSAVLDTSDYQIDPLHQKNSQSEMSLYNGGGELNHRTAVYGGGCNGENSFNGNGIDPNYNENCHENGFMPEISTNEGKQPGFLKKKFGMSK